MSRPLVSCIAVALILLGTRSALADPMDKLEDQLALINKQIDVATRAKVLADLEVGLANSEKLVAEHRKAAAEADFAKAQKLAEQVVQPIRVESGWLTVVGEPQKKCDAKPFLRGTCNGNTTICTFSATEAMCGQPGSNTDAMALTVEYYCAGTKMGDVFPYKAPAHLSCKGVGAVQ